MDRPIKKGIEGRKEAEDFLAKDTKQESAMTDEEIYLWQLLDDIDTASDIFKPSDEMGYRKFYKYAMKKVAERFNDYESDGFTVTKKTR